MFCSRFRILVSNRNTLTNNKFFALIHPCRTQVVQISLIGLQEIVGEEFCRNADV